MSPAVPPIDLPTDASVVVLSGAGLSAASGVPTFRGEGGLWRGHEAMRLATPEAFAADPDLVRDFYAHRRRAMDGIRPNAGHRALVRLQAALGAQRVHLVTQNVDGLLQEAAAEEGVDADILEMHGSLWTARCAASAGHPRLHLDRDTPDPRGRCEDCGALLRPDVVWFGELPRHMDRIGQALSSCGLFLAVGTSGVVYPAAGFVRLARSGGAACVEVNPDPTGGGFHHTIAQGAEHALPALVSRWLRPPRQQPGRG